MTLLENPKGFQCDSSNRGLPRIPNSFFCLFLNAPSTMGFTYGPSDWVT